MNLMKMEQDIASTRAQEEYIKMQQHNAEILLPAQLSSLEASIKNADAQTYKTYQDAKKARVEAENMTKTGTSGQNIFSQVFRDLVGATNKSVDNVKDTLDSKASGKSKYEPFWTEQGKKDLKTHRRFE